jgi:hypothetical protein
VLQVRRHCLRPCQPTQTLSPCGRGLPAASLRAKLRKSHGRKGEGDSYLTPLRGLPLTARFAHVLSHKGRAGNCCEARQGMHDPLRGAACTRVLPLFLAASGKGQGAPKGANLLWGHVHLWTCRHLPARHTR